ncbi:hypothetical protein HPB52_012552 [Rhipicephalus sanguineus]|uniref:Secreted protein n=1 Tax=Rhipicephalus sanguineus TaxID=34632 RepID=A0A9D4SWM5_RHISA|nr:hypothetical protein HPB52_012552 [Rhipicephalus sanguineus]
MPSPIISCVLLVPSAGADTVQQKQKEQSPPPHKYNLPSKFIEALQPIYQRLSDPQLLARGDHIFKDRDHILQPYAKWGLKDTNYQMDWSHP